jgi:beta-1,4-mannosyl-glycoprotein beta-1,4-N-acetylglucosaminyltransferase
MIYDCFTFFNELDLLELRLETLAHVVDYFVIVEADKTHAAAAKPFFFEENKNRFSKYLPKIIYAKPIDLSFPKPIIDNQEKYFHLIFPVTEEYLSKDACKKICI